MTRCGCILFISAVVVDTQRPMSLLEPAGATCVNENLKVNAVLLRYVWLELTNWG